MATTRREPSDEVNFSYMRHRKTGHPGVCVAYTVGPFRSETMDYEVNFGISIHCPRDTFKKSFGRHVAAARLKKKPFTISVSPGEDILDAVCFDLLYEWDACNNGRLRQYLKMHEATAIIDNDDLQPIP